MKSGPYWRISRRTIRRFLLRGGFVLAAAGTDPPWPPLLKGGSSAQHSRREISLLILHVFNWPLWPPPS